MIKRKIEGNILHDFKRNKIITLLGPRQVGKTTLLDQITAAAGKEKILSLNCDNEDDRQLLSNRTSTELKTLIGTHDMVMIDEAQRALALQVGSEVSYNELAMLIGADKATVEKYVDLLEKCFVVFRLPSYSRNMRNEIKKGKKIYFYDNGIRNAVLANFAMPGQRTDMGALWENFLISERLKRNIYSGSFAQMYFWRTQTQQEIDYIEESDGKLSAFEFKWNPRAKASLPKAFMDAYPSTAFEVITPQNYIGFV